MSGLTSGSIFALAALGLVLTQKTSGVFNFAHGAVAAAGAFAFWDLWQRQGLPWPLAALITIGVVGPLIGLLIERLTRALAGARPVLRVVSTVGLLLAIQGVLGLRYGTATLQFPRFLPGGTFRLFDVNVGYDQLITMVLAAAGAVALSRFLSATRTGIAMRGVVDDPALLGLSGVDPTRVRRISWVLGSSFAAAGGVLIGPFLGLDAPLLTLLVVQAFGAAAIGSFASLPLTYAGALLIGVAGDIANKVSGDVPSLGGLPPSVPFLVLFVVLLARPGRLRQAPVLGRPTPASLFAGARARWILLAVGVPLVVVAPHVVGAKLPLFQTGAAMTLVFLSLGLLVWTAGQVSLAHAAFVAVGASAFSELTVGVGLPWPVALVLAGLVTVPIGAIVAIPAIRLSGIYLALATLGFGILMQQLVYPTRFLFGQAGLRPIPRPDFPLIGGQSDTAFFYVQVIVVAICAVAVAMLLRSRLGRLLRAIADAPVALATHGASVSVALTLVFCFSAFFAGMAGALLGGVTEVVDGSPFGVFQSLLWLAVITIAGRTPLTSAVLGALLLAVVPGYLDLSPEFQSMAFGAAAILAAIASDAEGPRRSVARWASSSAERLTASPVRSRTEGHLGVGSVPERVTQ